MRERGTCEAWACGKQAVGHRANGIRVVHLCADHLPANAMDDDGPEDDAICDVCIKPKLPDITGELRCARCDDAIDSMVRGQWEDAVAEGRA